MVIPFRPGAFSFRILSKNISLTPSNLNFKLTPLIAEKYQVEFYETSFPSCEKKQNLYFLIKDTGFV